MGRVSRAASSIAAVPYPPSHGEAVGEPPDEEAFSFAKAFGSSPQMLGNFHRGKEGWRDRKAFQKWNGPLGALTAFARVCGELR